MDDPLYTLCIDTRFFFLTGSKQNSVENKRCRAILIFGCFGCKPTTNSVFHHRTVVTFHAKNERKKELHLIGLLHPCFLFILSSCLVSIAYWMKMSSERHHFPNQLSIWDLELLQLTSIVGQAFLLLISIKTEHFKPLTCFLTYHPKTRICILKKNRKFKNVFTTTCHTIM